MQGTSRNEIWNSYNPTFSLLIHENMSNGLKKKI
uniref:Uncharacterized protein n=1 Tax=viral metagenome TaxID=1070528 RepID=A0A6C0IDA2_9ZZZZ